MALGASCRRRLADLLEERGWSAADLAHRCGLTAEEAAALLSGEAPITEAVARRLAQGVGATAEFWLRREGRYREASS